MAAVSVLFAVTGSVGGILAGVQAFRSRFAGTRVEGLPDEERPSLRKRLADVDELLAKLGSRAVDLDLEFSGGFRSLDRSM